ncbi:tyrosinase family protein [Bradyrhizobium elkanii]|uniref:tyrosinase family protein n=1 Tax=Bradyrhizobium elkanii TaxID=29448 RepID=UPI001BAA1258|nr:tyrosinase family protein [Bradyrhizobium elkanii]MBR1164605.1 tyrosinase family protein [Bradyrhizobium elkanii]
MAPLLSSRRTLLLGSLALGATTSLATWAAPGSALPRRPVTAIETDPGELQILRKAIALLQGKDAGGRPASDGWQAIANPHVDHCFTGDTREIHFSWWFWPWHRAYLLAVEKRLQTVVAEPKLRLAYWDWFSVRGLPGALSSPTYKDGAQDKPNPLFDPTRAKGPEDRPAGLNTTTITDAVLGGYASEEDLLRRADFAVVGGQLAPPGGSASTTGVVEGGPHNNIHVWVGGFAGNMSQAFSPLDPAFLFHHCNIDRLWSVWLKLTSGGAHNNPTDPAWLNHTFPLPHPSGIGTDTYKIADLLDTEQSGYTYEGEPIRISQAQNERTAQTSTTTLKFNTSPLDLSGGEVVTGLQPLEQGNVRLRDLLPSRPATLTLSEIRLPPSTTTLAIYVRSEQIQRNEEQNLVGVYTLLNPRGSSIVTDLRVPLPQRVSELLATLPNLGFAVVANSVNRDRMSGFTVREMTLTIE